MTNLWNIYQFELALDEPLMAMADRGVPIDETVRQQMIAELDAELEPLREDLCSTVVPLIAAKKSVPKRHLFEEQWVCPCCRAGSKKKVACWSCAGLKKAPGKTIAATLKPCTVCAGEGRRQSIVFNPGSHEQLKIVLFSVLKLPQRVSTDEEALKDLLAHDRSGVVEKMLTINKHTTMRSVLERIAPGPDGRIRTFMSPAGTETGRLNHAASWLEPQSTNLGNLPKKVAKRDVRYNVRRCIVPPPGYALVEGDLSQAEARIVAALCNDHVLLDRWTNDPTFDVHKYTASIAFDKPAEEVTMVERDCIGKTARHAVGYAEGPMQYMRSVNKEADLTGYSITLAQARTFLERTQWGMKGLEAWWRRVYDSLEATGQLATALGRERTFYGRRKPDHWLDGVHKEAIAYEPQSTVADVLNRGLLRWWQQWDGRMGQMILQIHDALLLLVPVGLVSQTARLLRKTLEEEIVVNGIALTIPADISTSTMSWAEMEKVPR